jgi:hypothetical protein
MNTKRNEECLERKDAGAFAQAGGFDASPYAPGLC